MRTVMSGSFALLVLSTVGGCQSWSQINPAIPTGARVPPPGTGTYPVPGQYYNAPKTGAVAPAGGAQTAATTSPSQVTTAAWQPPTVDQLRNDINNTAGAAFQNATSRANQVVQAGTARAASAAERYTAPLAQGAPVTTGNYATSPISSTRSLSDSGEGAELDWQPPR